VSSLHLILVLGAATTTITTVAMAIIMPTVAPTTRVRWNCNLIVYLTFHLDVA
jgi:hypothetical protein